MRYDALVKVLCAMMDYGEQKAYVRDKYWEMHEACIAPLGIHTVVASEASDKARGNLWLPLGAGYAYVEDMLMVGREQMRQFAVDYEYDILLWQGIDALWQSAEDVEKVLNSKKDIVGPVINARTFPGRAVARRFVQVDGKWTEDQVDIPHEELVGDKLVLSGFPGGDNIAIQRHVFEQISWADGSHDPWYQRVAEGRPNIDCIEWYCLQALKAGFKCWLDGRVKVWHVDEDGTARMYPSGDVPLSTLSW